MAYKPTTSYKGMLPKKTVQKGVTGTSVKALQSFLNWCINTNLPLDGICGDETTSAIKQFQTRYKKAYKLAVDGIFGAGSLAAAKKIVAAHANEPSGTKVRIGFARRNENGSYTAAGKAGDQNKEVLTTKWAYSKDTTKPSHWLYVFRAKDIETRLKLGQAMAALCNNNHIGYDATSPDKYSAYDEAAKVKWQISKITKNCETTNAGAISICLRAVGVNKAAAPRKCTVASLTKLLMSNTAFTKYTGSNYRAKDTLLQPGDILVSNGRMVIVTKSPNTPKVITPQDKMLDWAKKIAGEKYHYVLWREGVAKTHTCPICTGRVYDDYYGWNCIGFAWACWHHGAGLASRCSCAVFTDYHYNQLLNLSAANALALAKSRIGLNDIQLIRGANGISLSQLKPGDVIAYFTRSGYIHTALYIGNGLIADCTSSRSDGIMYGVKSYTGWTIKLAFRYTGK